MRSKIEVHSNGASDIEPYINKLIDLEKEIIAGGVEFEIFQIKSIEPVSTIVITIIGAVASHYIIKLVDSLILRKKEQPNDMIKIKIIYNHKTFFLPNKQVELKNELEKNKD